MASKNILAKTEQSEPEQSESEQSESEQSESESESEQGESEQIEPDMVIKEESSSLASELESVFDKATPAPIQPSTPITPVSEPKNRDHSPVNSNVAQEQPDLQQQTKLRLAAKSLEIKAAKKWLEGFPAWLRPMERNIPEVGDWIEDIMAILQHSVMPKVFLGFMGPSGCGKSSVINALLEEEGLLPCNCMEACTAVPVEIAWNTIDDNAKAYRAEIKFVTAAEWKAELDLLVAELMSLEPAARANPRTEDGKIAFAKIQAVYPDFDFESMTDQAASELINDSVISEWLGTTVKIIEPAGRQKRFSTEISKYIDSSPKINSSRAHSRKAAPYWPLVKVVQVFTRASVLQTGLVLVDLPGSGDSNAARVAVADDYMRKVSAICIVADIKRALTSAIARNLFGRGAAIKQRLFREGLLDDAHTFFVLTCTDIINNEQVIGTQGLIDLPEVSDLLQQQRTQQRNLQVLVEKRQGLASRLDQSLLAETQIRRKIRTQSVGVKPSPKLDDGKQTETELDSSAGSMKTPNLGDLRRNLAKREQAHKAFKNKITNSVEEEKAMKEKIDIIETDLAAICIRERNSYVTARMKEDFSIGLRELEEDLADEGEEAAASELQPAVSTSGDGIHTFCVCSKAYQKLRGRFPLEQTPVGFRNFRDTSIPQLLKYCKEFTLNAREKLADVFLEDLTRLRRRMREWSDNTIPDKEITLRQKRELENGFKGRKEGTIGTVLESIDQSMKLLREDLATLNRKAKKSAARNSASKTGEAFTRWTQAVHNVRTFKALCRKEGVHVGRAGNEKIEFNWNDDLAEEFLKMLDKNLRKLISQTLPAMAGDHTQEIDKLMTEFEASLQHWSTNTTPNVVNSVRNFMENSERRRVEALRQITVRFDVAIAMSRGVGRRVLPIIQDAMRPGYIAANNITGTGCFQKSKDVIENHIKKASGTMYVNAAKELFEGLSDIIALLKDHLQKDFNESMRLIQGDFVKMVQRASETPRPETSAAKIELQAEVLEKLSHFDGVLGEFQSQTNHVILIEDDLDDLDAVKIEKDDNAEPNFEDELGMNDMDAMDAMDVIDDNDDLADILDGAGMEVNQASLNDIMDTSMGGLSGEDNMD